MSVFVRSNLSILALSFCTASAFAAHKPASKKTATPPTGINRTVKEFSTINVGGNFKVSITNNKAQQLLIQTTPTLAKCVLTDVNGATLYIYQRSTKACNTAKSIKLAINTPNLKSIMTHGNNISTVTNLNTRTFLSYSSGRSHLSLSGKTRSLNSVISGEAFVDAQTLHAKTAQIRASGNSQIQLQTQDSLFVSASGNAAISYSGNPKKLTKSLSGTSSVTHSTS